MRIDDEKKKEFVIIWWLKAGNRIQLHRKLNGICVRSKAIARANQTTK